MGDKPRPEHPRPDWYRAGKQWQNLNGPWKFAFDDQDVGLLDGWWGWRDQNSDIKAFNKTITVPFAHQTELSGIYDRGPHEVVWYARSISKPQNHDENERVLLHFGAVDYHATVWVDSNQVCRHSGMSD